MIGDQGQGFFPQIHYIPPAKSVLLSTPSSGPQRYGSRLRPTGRTIDGYVPLRSCPEAQALSVAPASKKPPVGRQLRFLFPTQELLFAYWIEVDDFYASFD